MATMAPDKTRTMTAAADLSAQVYRGARRDANGQALVAQAGAANFAGVIIVPNTSGRVVTVCTRGRVKMYAGEAITLPAKITTDANGRAMVADTAGDYVIGTAVGGAGQAGQIMEVDLDLGGGYVVPA
jgi:hypothetical protein